MRAAFLAWLAPDAVLYRDGPVNGPAAIAARPDPPIVLDWRPAFVEAAASGELGFSTGPWRITSRADPAAAARHGQFFSVWRRPPGGPWRVQVDLGISHPGDALWSEPLRAGTTPGADAGGGSIAQAEALFAKTAAEAGDASAYGAHASDSLRLYREGLAPFLGREAALSSPAAGATPTAWTLEAHATSEAGDLGYATGRYGPPGGPVQGHYVRVWRREPGGWRIAADIVNALAPR
jgi:ketosteroid isomerase-like protein